MFKEQKIQISYTTMPKFQMEGLQQKWPKQVTESRWYA
jgi:hypothetical protein